MHENSHRYSILWREGQRPRPLQFCWVAEPVPMRDHAGWEWIQSLEAQRSHWYPAGAVPNLPERYNAELWTERVDSAGAHQCRCCLLLSDELNPRELSVDNDCLCQCRVVHGPKSERQI